MIRQRKSLELAFQNLDMTEKIRSTFNIIEYD